MKKFFKLYEFWPVDLGANRCREQAKKHENITAPQIDKNLQSFSYSTVGEIKNSINKIPQTLGMISGLESDLRFFLFFLGGVLYRYSNYIIAEKKKLKADEKKAKAAKKAIEKRIGKEKPGVIELRKKAEEKKHKEFQKKLQKRIEDISKDEMTLENIKQHLKQTGINERYVERDAEQLIEALKDARIASNWADVSRDDFIMGFLKRYFKERTGAGPDALLRELKNAVIKIKDYHLDLSKKTKIDAKKRFNLMSKIIAQCILAIEISEKIVSTGVDENLRKLKGKVSQLVARISTTKNQQLIKKVNDAIKEVEEHIGEDKRKIFVNFMTELNTVNMKFSRAKIAA